MERYRYTYNAGMFKDDIPGEWVKYADVAELERQNERLLGENRGLVLRNCILRDRPDLPPERLAFHDHVVKLQAALDAERARVKVDKEVYFGKIADLQTQVAQLTAERDDVQALYEQSTASRDKFRRVSEMQSQVNDRQAKALTQLQQLVGEIYRDLPIKRDWLDPVLEERIKATLSVPANPAMLSCGHSSGMIAKHCLVCGEQDAPATHEVTKAQVFNEWGEALRKMADDAKPKEEA